MAWIKRNLFLVVGGVVTLGLLALAGFFLFTKYTQDQAITEQLNQNTEELKRLVGRDPHPGTDKVDNIGAAKTEHKKLQASLDQVRKYFPPTQTNHPTSREFRAMLDNAISELKFNAERSAVKLPDEYWFTFSAQKATTTFPTNLLGPLTSQLSDIADLCRILYDAKIMSLERIKRVSAGQEDGGGSLTAGMSQDYLDAKAVTNQWAVVMPYEVTFQGFSSELADVLEGLIRSRRCFVVKNLIVERADASSSDDASGMGIGASSGESQPTVNPYARYGAAGMSRYGQRGMSPELMRRYGMGPQAPVAPTTKPAGRPGVLLEEKALRFTLSINSVRLKPSAGK